MELLIIRHGIAVDREEGADETADAARPLTRRGIRRFRRSVRGLDRLGVIVDHVLHSPKRRAVETAQLLAPILAHDEAFQSTPLLAAPPRADLLAHISALGDARVAVVGHEPHLSALIALLTVGTERAVEGLELKKGGVAWLTGSAAPGSMRVLAHLPPRILRRIR